MPNCTKNIISIDALNNAPMAEACELLAPIFERSPWLANAIVQGRPFFSTTELGDRIRETIFSLSKQDALILLNAHPELAPSSPETMTDASQSEQGRLGLITPKPDIARRLIDLNAAYRARHGFPFVTALHKFQTMDAVFAQFEHRLNADTPTEMRSALGEVVSVATQRLDDVVEAGQRGVNCAQPTIAPTHSRKVAQ